MSLYLCFILFFMILFFWHIGIYINIGGIILALWDWYDTGNIILEQVITSMQGGV